MADFATIDFETRSTVDLRKTGTEVYAEHPTTWAWCLGWALDDGEPEIWQPGEPLPRELYQHILLGRKVVAHNAHFEMIIWDMLRRRGEDLPPLDPEQVDCTMARARALALPGSLEEAAQALRLPVQKDMEGRRLMLQMARPRKKHEDGRLEWWEDEVKRERLFSYCKQDVITERVLHLALPPLSDEERRTWLLDWKINQRGVMLDIPAVTAARALVEEEGKALSAEVKRLTNGKVPGTSTVKQMLQWVKDNNVDVDALAKKDVKELLERESLRTDVERSYEEFDAWILRMPNGLASEETVRKVIELRKEAAKASTAKLKAMGHSACADGRARGLFSYSVASTRRWAGRRIQTQNMPRMPKHFKPDDAANLIDWLQYPNARKAIRLEYGNVMDAMSWSLRSFLVAAPGKRFVCADYSNIEGRVGAWLSGEEWKLQAFRDVDAGHGHDIYKLAYSKSFGVKPDDVDDDKRQVGKVQELALLFGGAHGAFVSMAAIYGIKLETLADMVQAITPAHDWEYHADFYNGHELSQRVWVAIRIVATAWRKAHPRVVQTWKDCEAAAIAAVKNPGLITEGGPLLRYRKSGDFLFCRLPSGGCLAYPYPFVQDTMKWGKPTEELVFFGQDQITHKWEEQRGWGGYLFQNAVQGTARDKLDGGLKRAEDAGYPVVMHVHDSILSEVIEGFGSLEEFIALIVRGDPWEHGLPVAAAGYEAKRFHK